jgi:hypothetical protein
MGGEAGMSSRPGEGSCFWFTAWVERCPAAADAPADALLAEVRTRRALVVDDLPVSLSALSDTLSVLGLQVQALDDPQAALRLVQAEAAAGRALRPAGAGLADARPGRPGHPAGHARRAGRTHRPPSW